MTRARLTWLTVVAAATMAAGCSGTNARDINFDTDAQSGFEPPPNAVDGAVDTAVDLAGVTGTAGVQGVAGTGGTAGSAGSAGSAGGGVNDGAIDGVSDGG